MNNQVIRRAGEELTLSADPTIYGCCGIFDLCGDRDLMSLSFAGQERFLDWLGWRGTTVCEEKRYFIPWIRPDADAFGARSTGVVTAANRCGPANGAEWGICDWRIDHFGRLRRAGPVRDVTQNVKRLCVTQPRYRLDGSQIMDDAEFDMRIATEALMQDLKRLVISGNHANDGEFDGLETLVKTGYTDSAGRRCSSMDSIIIDWNGNGLQGGAGMTWNGSVIPATYDFVDVLLAAFRRVLDRIQLAPALASSPLQPGNMIFVAPTHLLRCLLDFYTCWSVCNGAAFNEVVIQSYEARTYRNNLNGGMFQAGRIWLDGFEIPLMAYDWGLTKGPTLSDAYLLTNAIGTTRVINGEYLDMTSVPAGYPDAAYATTDGGRLLTWISQDHTCVQRTMEMQPRLNLWAPWTAVRFQDVKCVGLGGVIGPDPWDTSFFPETSFNPAVCLHDPVVPAPIPV